MLCNIIKFKCQNKSSISDINIHILHFNHKTHRLQQRKSKSCFTDHKAVLNGAKRLSFKNYFRSHFHKSFHFKLKR